MHRTFLRLKIFFLLYDDYKNVVNLFKKSSLDFHELFFAQVSQQSKRCFVHLFDCSSDDFGCHSFYFCSAVSDHLIDPLFGDFVNVCHSVVNNTRSNFTNLIDRVSAGIREVVAAEKTSSLSPTTLSCLARTFCSSTSLVGIASVACAFFGHVFELICQSLAIARTLQCFPFLLCVYESRTCSAALFSVSFFVDR